MEYTKYMKKFGHEVDFASLTDEDLASFNASSFQGSKTRFNKTGIYTNVRQGMVNNTCYVFGNVKNPVIASKAPDTFEESSTRFSVLTAMTDPAEIDNAYKFNAACQRAIDLATSNRDVNHGPFKSGCVPIYKEKGDPTSEITGHHLVVNFDNTDVMRPTEDGNVESIIWKETILRDKKGKYIFDLDEDGELVLRTRREPASYTDITSDTKLILTVSLASYNKTGMGDFPTRGIKFWLVSATILEDEAKKKKKRLVSKLADMTPEMREAAEAAIRARLAQEAQEAQEESKGAQEGAQEKDSDKHGEEPSPKAQHDREEPPSPRAGASTDTAQKEADDDAVSVDEEVDEVSEVEEDEVSEVEDVSVEEEAPSPPKKRGRVSSTESGRAGKRRRR